MSVLMTLKYPISTPPTREQLEAIPSEAFVTWVLEIGYKVGGKLPSFTPNTPKQVANTFKEFYEKVKGCEKSTKALDDHLQKLKDRIYNLDE